MKKKKALKIIIIAICIVILIPILIVGGYVIYVFASYSRIGNKDLEIDKNSSINQVETNKELKLTTINYGFGAYSTNYTFFMDEGENLDGTKTKGTYGKGISYEDVYNNTTKLTEEILKLDSDFYSFQEVDINSDRAYHINQQEYINSKFKTYDSTFGINYNSSYLCYPLNDPIGKSLSGLLSLSKYNISSSSRIEYTISDSFSKFFDLDRCFVVNKLKVDNNKELVFINSHMSAYDEGGLIRNKQIQELYSYMQQEYLKGNYVIASGDFNHDLLTNNPLYPQYNFTNYAYKDIIKQNRPSWLNFMFSENKTSPFDDGFKIYAANNNPSCRDCDVIYTPNSTFVSTVDGFIVSNNVDVKSTYTTKIGENCFAYSDHQPSTLTFVLK